VDTLSLGVIARTRKENEQRVPVHPLHLERIAPQLRARIHLEHGYGERFGVSDEQLGKQVAGLGSRQQLIDACDVILLAKPVAADLEELREGQVLWGWPHCVQDTALTQVAIDRRLTLIAFEAMNHWTSDGAFNLHVFHQNNELAGYCSVLHAFQLAGSTGSYGPRLRAAVIGFGATARGAVTVLNAHGVHDVDVLTHREVSAVGAPISSARIVQYSHDDADPERSTVSLDGQELPLAQFLAEHDVIVNCVLQDPTSPAMFLVDADLPTLRPGTLIVDVSCDEGMGFSWARPTSFEAPTFTVGDNVQYYGVDHSPSYLWNSASWAISEALLPHLPTVLGGPSAWDSDDIIKRAIEIRAGAIQNPDILSFQNRSVE
jgi:alanine dehydrogenase